MLPSSSSSSPSSMMINELIIIILTGYGFPIASILLRSMDPDLSTCCRRQPHKNYIWENNRNRTKTKSKKRKDGDQNNNMYMWRKKMQNPTTFKHIFIALGPSSSTLFSDKMSLRPFKMKCKGSNTFARFPWNKVSKAILHGCLPGKKSPFGGESPLGSSGSRLSWQATPSPLCSHLTL